MKCAQLFIGIMLCIWNGAYGMGEIVVHVALHGVAHLGVKAGRATLDAIGESIEKNKQKNRSIFFGKAMACNHLGILEASGHCYQVSPHVFVCSEKGTHALLTELRDFCTSENIQLFVKKLGDDFMGNFVRGYINFFKENAKSRTNRHGCTAGRYFFSAQGKVGSIPNIYDEKLPRTIMEIYQREADDLKKYMKSQHAQITDSNNQAYTLGRALCTNMVNTIIVYDPTQYQYANEQFFVFPEHISQILIETLLSLINFPVLSDELETKFGEDAIKKIFRGFTQKLKSLNIILSSENQMGEIPQFYMRDKVKNDSYNKKNLRLLQAVMREKSRKIILPKEHTVEELP